MDSKLIVLLVVALGVGGLFYLKQTEEPPVTKVTPSAEESTSVPADDADAMLEPGDSLAENSVPVMESTPAVAGSVEDTLAVIDNLFVEGYDDSSLEAQFSDDAFNSFSNSITL